MEKHSCDCDVIHEKMVTDEPSKLLEAMKVARAVRRIVIQNVVFSLTVKGLFLVLGAFGIAGGGRLFSEMRALR